MLKFVALVGLVAVAFAQGGAPPFLEKASPAKQAEFGQLLQANAGQPDNVIDKKVEDWVAQQDAGIKTAFAAFKKEIEEAEKEGERAHQAAIAHFSPAAKEADAKLSAIANNNQLPANQKGQQIDALLKSLPANVRQEIEKAMNGQ